MRNSNALRNWVHAVEIARRNSCYKTRVEFALATLYSITNKKSKRDVS